ncbi:MAG: carbohydrate ABC transporter permease [Alphaproteobacteria bacterium]|nr:MAG: carbohydrate ABC transporter permease [Alphaproteobacteria bacterium]
MSARVKKSLIYWSILSPLMVVILFPYAVMFFTAIKPRAEIFAFPPRWLPSAPRWENFIDMWQATGFGPALLNSLYIAIASTALCLAVAIPAGYALSRFEFRGKGLYRQFLLITQMLSPIVLVIGIFRLMARLGLVDQLNSLVLAYGAFTLAFATWMLQSYFTTIPKEFEEAALIDGANRAQSLARIFVPLAAPAVAVTAILTFIYSWNEFVLALTLLRSSALFTLQIKIYSLVGGRYTVEWDHVMAATLLATVPVAAVFAWLQRYMVRGMALGGLR